MAVQIHRGSALASLNLTPLIDVLFLLLIFYLAAARLSQEDAQLDVPLPTASNALPMTAEPQELIVNIDQSGRYVIEGETVTLASMEDIVRRAVADNPNSHQIVIRADRRVELQSAVDVMDLCLRCSASYSLTTAEEAQQ